MPTTAAPKNALTELKKREDLLRILIFTLITAFIWIGFSIFQSQRETKVSSDVQKHTQPLNPNIDRNTIAELESKRRYSDEELTNFDIYKLTSTEDGRVTVQSIFVPTPAPTGNPNQQLEDDLPSEATSTPTLAPTTPTPTVTGTL
jgi:hypothetical protein